MNKKIYKENSQALYNILSTVILSGISFLTIPIFTRLLGAEQYGLYSVFHSWITIVMCFITMECRTGLGTAKYTFEEDYLQYKSSSLLMGLSISAIFIFGGIIFKDFIAQLIGYPSYIVVFILITSLAYHLVEFAKNAFIYEKKAKYNFILSVTLSIATVVFSLVFLKTNTFSDKYLDRAYGDIIPYCVVAVIIVAITFAKEPGRYNKSYWRYCFIMGFPIVFHGLSQDVLKQSDRIMMQNMEHGGVEVGIYSFFCTYTAIVNVVLTALNTTWCPFYYDDLNESRFDSLKIKCKNYMELFTVITIGFLLVSREVCYMFANDEYWEGMSVIPLLIVSIYFIFLYQFPVNFEFYNKKTRIIAIGTFFTAVVNILLNLLLIPWYGMYGAAVATAVSYGMLFVAHSIIAKNLKEMKYHIKIKNVIPWLVLVVIFSISFYLLKSFVVFRWVLAVMIAVIELLRMYKRGSIF